MMVSLARLMVLYPADAVALPTAITVCAGKVGMAESAFISECMRNKPLREYVAGVCRQVIGDIVD